MIGGTARRNHDDGRRAFKSLPWPCFRRARAYAIADDIDAGRAAIMPARNEADVFRRRFQLWPVNGDEPSTPLFNLSLLIVYH